MKIVDIIGCSRCGIPYVASLNVICNEYDIVNIPGCDHAICRLIDDYNRVFNYVHGEYKIYSVGLKQFLSLSPAEFELFTYWCDQLTYIRSYLEKDSTITHAFKVTDVGMLLVKKGMIYYPITNVSYYSITPCTKIGLWNSISRHVLGISQ